MQVLKFLILIIILGVSCFIGILMSKKYSNRVEELRQFKNALNMLKTKIKFTYEPLVEVFYQISISMPQNIANVFQEASVLMKNMTVKESWENAINNSKLSLTHEDTNVIKELGKLLRKNRYRWTS